MSGSALTDPINGAPVESNAEAELKAEPSKWANQFGTELDKAWVDRPAAPKDKLKLRVYYSEVFDE